MQSNPTTAASEKACTRCGATKPLEEFSVDRYKATGRASACKPCAAKKTREWKLDHPEYKPWLTDRGREIRRAAAKRWRDNNPERAREVSRKSQRKRMLRPEVREASLQWKMNNPEKNVLYARRTLCKKHGITLDDYKKIFEAQKGSCAICRKAETEKCGELCIDHDHNCCPGTHSCGKCVRGLICSKCNQALGCFRDDPGIMLNAIYYVAGHRPTIAASTDRKLYVQG